MSETKILPFLTDDEIAGICEGVTVPGWQCKHLQRMGLHYIRKPNGRPLVARSEFERVVGAGRFGSKAQNDPISSPNVASLMAHLDKRKPNGKTAQRR